MGTGRCTTATRAHSRATTDASAAHREATGRPLISAGRLRLRRHHHRMYAPATMTGRCTIATRAHSRTMTDASVALQGAIGRPRISANLQSSKRKPKVVVLATTTGRCTTATRAHSRAMTDASAAHREATGRPQISASGQQRLSLLSEDLNCEHSLSTVALT